MYKISSTALSLTHHLASSTSHVQPFTHTSLILTHLPPHHTHQVTHLPYVTMSYIHFCCIPQMKQSQSKEAGVRATHTCTLPYPVPGHTASPSSSNICTHVSPSQNPTSIIHLASSAIPRREELHLFLTFSALALHVNESLEVFFFIYDASMSKVIRYE